VRRMHLFEVSVHKSYLKAIWGKASLVRAFNLSQAAHNEARRVVGNDPEFWQAGVLSGVVVATVRQMGRPNTEKTYKVNGELVLSVGSGDEEA